MKNLWRLAAAVVSFALVGVVGRIVVADPGRVCATGPTLRGVDVSTYNGVIDWSTAKAAGIAFAIARISDGVEFLDATFDGNWSAMKAASVVRGAYQYFEPDQDVDAQADLMIAKMATLAPGDLAPTIDVEVTGALTAEQLAARVQRWIERVADATDRVPMVYTSLRFWSGYVDNAGDGSNPLWVANYGVSCPLVPLPWTRWAIWQTSGSGTVAGIPGDADLDVFNGDLAELQRFADGDGACGVGASNSPCVAAGIPARCDDGCASSSHASSLWMCAVLVALVIRRRYHHTSQRC